MTIGKWITMASAAALLAAVAGCKDNAGGSSVGTRTSSEQTQGRRGDTLPRARGADAGADMSPSSGSASGSSATGSPSQDTSGSAGATSGSASGTTGSTGTGTSGSSSDTTSK